MEEKKKISKNAIAKYYQLTEEIAAKSYLSHIL